MMFSYTIDPRFSETDALGHINNGVLAVWLEQARTPIFELFNPSLSLQKWNLILARLEIDFVAQIFYGNPVEIRTQIARIGNSSTELQQDLYQQEKLVAKSRAILIHFDYQSQKAAPIPLEIRSQLEVHLQSSGTEH